MKSLTAIISEYMREIDRKGGLKGGRVRATGLTRERRRAITSETRRRWARLFRKMEERERTALERNRKLYQLYIRDEWED